MAGEEQYYNPIIQSMIAAQQGNLQRAKLQQEAEQFKADRAIREHQLNLEETRAGHEYEHQKGLLDIQKALADAQVQMNQLQRVKAARDLSTSGVNVQKAFAGSPMGFDLSSIPSTEDLQRQEAENIQRQAFAQGTGAGMAAQPFAEAAENLKHTHAMELHQSDKAMQLAIASLNRESAERVADKAAARAESVARIEGGYHLRGIQMMHQLGMGDQSEMAKQLVDGIFNGNRDYKALTPDEKRLVEGYTSGTGELGSLPTNQKEYEKRLESLGSIQVLLNQYKNLALNYSRDSKGAFSKGNQTVTVPGVGTLQRTVSGSDLENALNAMKASGGQLASYFDQQNRKSDAEILRQVLGSFDPKATKAQNIQKLEQHTQQLQGAVKRTFGNMNPDRANSIMQNMGITDLGFDKSQQEEYELQGGKLVKKGGK